MFFVEHSARVFINTLPCTKSKYYIVLSKQFSVCCLPVCSNCDISCSSSRSDVISQNCLNRTFWVTCPDEGMTCSRLYTWLKKAVKLCAEYFIMYSVFAKYDCMCIFDSDLPTLEGIKWWLKLPLVLDKSQHWCTRRDEK